MENLGLQLILGSLLLLSIGTAVVTSRLILGRMKKSMD